MTDIALAGPDGLYVEIPEIAMYSDSTTRVKVPDFERIAPLVDTLYLRPSALSSLLAGLSVADGVIQHGGRITQLVLPYLPGARQDRANPTGDAGFMLATVARLVNSYGFNRVIAVDPHSHMASALIANLEPLPYARLYSNLWRGYSGVIAPDKGARARAKLAHGVLFRGDESREYREASKVRDPATGRLSGFEVEVTPGAHYLVVDDICDGGGTFIGLGEKIREQGAFADLFITHGIFAKGVQGLGHYYRQIFTTNTRSIRDEVRSFVTVLDVMTDIREDLGR